MPDMWLDTDTAVVVPVNKFPLKDSTDFVTTEEAIVYNSAGMDLTWMFTTTAGATTATAVTPTTGGNYDWGEPIANKGMYTIEIPASGGASINNDTEGFGYFVGHCTGVLSWISPVFGFRSATMNDLMVDGTETFVTDAELWSYGTRTLTALDEDTTTIDLNGTTIGTVSAVTAISAGGITAASFAAGAIDATAIADAAIDAATFAAGAITAAAVADGAIDAGAIADNAIDAGAIATGAITSAKFAAGAITAASIATDAIDADALAADAVTEIANGVFDHDISGHTTTSNTFGLWIHRIRQYLTNKTDEATDSTSVSFLSEADDTTPVGTQSWDEATGVRGRWTAGW